MQKNSVCHAMKVKNRQKRILAYISAERCNAKELADKLEMSEKTIKRYIKELNSQMSDRIIVYDPPCGNVRGGYVFREVIDVRQFQSWAELLERICAQGTEVKKTVVGTLHTACLMRRKVKVKREISTNKSEQIELLPFNLTLENNSPHIRGINALTQKPVNYDLREIVAVNY